MCIIVIKIVYRQMRLTYLVPSISARTYWYSSASLLSQLKFFLPTGSDRRSTHQRARGARLVESRVVNARAQARRAVLLCLQVPVSPQVRPTTLMSYYSKIYRLQFELGLLEFISESRPLGKRRSENVVEYEGASRCIDYVVPAIFHCFNAKVFC